MNWAEIRRLFISTCGQAPAATAEAYRHLTEGLSTISARLDLEEAESIDYGVATVASTDYVNLPSDLYHIIHVFELSSGQELEPEPGGIRGRANYLAQTTGMPSEGPPRWYARSGQKLYLRPTPDAATYTIKVRGKAQMTELTEADLGSDPVLPQQYHMAIMWAAAISFLQTHPKILKELGGTEFVASLERQLNDRLANQELPKDRERFDKRGRMYLRGFRYRR